MKTEKEIRSDVKKPLFAGFRIDGAFILSSILCLLPILLSIAVYGHLPDKVVMQWNFAGEPNWYAHKAVLAFGLPILLFITHIIINVMINSDPKRENITKTMRMFIAWFTPCLSLLLMPIALFMNMGVDLPVVKMVFTFVGLVLIFVGNYLPKTRQNDIVGIKTPWTLKNTDNWNKTHRLAGILFIVGGILFAVTAFLPLENATGIAIAICIVLFVSCVPPAYSYCLHKKRGA